MHTAMMTPVEEDRIRALVDGAWQRMGEESRITSLHNGWLCLTLPFTDCHGDLLQCYIRHERDGDYYLVSDDGYLIRDLQAGGHLSADTDDWRKSLTDMLANFAVYLSGDALCMRSSAAHFPYGFRDYIQAMLAVPAWCIRLDGVPSGSGQLALVQGTAQAAATAHGGCEAYILNEGGPT